MRLRSQSCDPAVGVRLSDGCHRSGAATCPGSYVEAISGESIDPRAELQARDRFARARSSSGIGVAADAEALARPRGGSPPSNLRVASPTGLRVLVADAIGCHVMLAGWALRSRSLRSAVSAFAGTVPPGRLPIGTDRCIHRVPLGKSREALNCLEGQQ